MFVTALLPRGFEVDTEKRVNILVAARVHDERATASEAPSTDTKDFLIWWIDTLHMTHMTSLAKLDHSLFALLSKCTSW